MKTDSLFYRLFQREPALVLELAELAISPTGYWTTGATGNTSRRPRCWSS